ncbi:MAG: tetratricopeptide repeat protein [Fimbriimonadales bacterium]
MKVAVLPLNAAQNTPAALGRQFSNFVADTLRSATGSEINAVSFLAQMEGEGGARAAFVNVSDTLMEWAWLEQMFEQSEFDRILDGLLKLEEGMFTMTTRVFGRGVETPIHERTETFGEDAVFDKLRAMLGDLSEYAEVPLPADLQPDNLSFGTENAKAFLQFLEGYDALQYVQQAEGRVALEFNPQPSIESLLAASQADPDFVAPYETLVQLCRLLTQYQIGKFEWVEAALVKLTELAPDDFKAFYALGEAYQAVGNLPRAADFFEKAIALAPEESAIYTRLGLVQMQMNMPVNAERNFKKAVELEGDDKPSLDFLAGVLQQSNRAHEIPGLWKEQIDKQPQNPMFRGKYAVSLIQAGQEDDGAKAFEEGLAAVEDNLVIKRFYAPYLSQKGEFDRAMDFYEDFLDSAPNDVPTLWEYANTLKGADREFEVPKVLKDILASNPEPNLRANVLSWLTEIEQPKRAEAVAQANEKLQKGDVEGALRDLKPMRNWLADYWKLWIVLANAYNQAGMGADAEDAATRLVNLFPGFEPAWGELLQALTMQGKYEEAYNAMRFAVNQLPQSLPAHVHLALAAKRSGREDEAKALARQIREAVGPNEELETVLSEVDR